MLGIIPLTGGSLKSLLQLLADYFQSPSTVPSMALLTAVSAPPTPLFPSPAPSHPPIPSNSSDVMVTKSKTPDTLENITKEKKKKSNKKNNAQCIVDV